MNIINLSTRGGNTLQLVEEFMSDLEKKFKEVSDKISAEIAEQLKTANEAVNKAVELSEKHGIPFRAPVSPLVQNYVPRSFDNLWPDLDTDCLKNIGVWYTEDGWEHSRICY